MGSQHKFCWILLFSMGCSWPAFGLSRGAFESTKVGLTQQNFTGPSKSSFADGSPAYGAEVSVDVGGSYFRYFVKTRFNTSTGSQNFIKSGTTYFSNYEYMSISPEIGGAFYPIARDDKGLNIYVWGVLNISYNYLELKNIPSTVKVDSKSQEFGTGYGAGLGFEYVFAARSHTKNSSHWELYGEVGFRNTYASLAGQSDFQVSGMTAAVGLGF